MDTLRRELEAHLAELSAEVRNYPTPIARCDEQLTALIERRSRIVARLAELDQTPAGGCTPLSAWTNDGGSDSPTP